MIRPRFMLSVFFMLGAWQTPATAGDAIDKEWQALAQRAAQGGKNVAPLRTDLLRFWQRHGGTTQALKAADLLRDLRSPLDQLDAKNIPTLEKFDWLPKETVAILGEHRGRHAGPVNGLSFSKNGKWLASSSTNSLVRIWDATTMRLLHTLSHGGGAYCATFSKDSTQLFHGGGDGQIVIEDMTVDPPKAKEPCKVASTPLMSIALGPAAKWFVTGGSDTRLCIWDLTANPPKELTAGNGHKDAIHAVVVAPDGKTIASAGADKTIRLWSFVNNKLQDRGAVQAHAGVVHALAWHPTDDKALVSGGDDGVLRVWSLVGGKLVQRFQYKSDVGGINALTFSPSGKSLAAAWTDGNVRIYSFAANVGLGVKMILEGHVTPAGAVAFAPDSPILASGGDDWTVRLWPIGASPRPKDKTIKVGHWSHGYAVAFDPNEKGLVSGSYDRTMRSWDLSGAAPKERTPHMKVDNAIHAVAFSPDGKTVAGGGLASTVHTFDPLTTRAIFTFTGHEGYINKLAFAPTGGVLASAGVEKSLRLWNLKNGKPLDSISTFENYVNAVAYSPDGKHLLCASGDYLRDDKGQVVYKNDMPVFADSTIRLYDAATLKETYRWKNDRVLPHAIAFTPDGKHFFAAASDGLLRRWETADPKAPKVFHKDDFAHHYITCSPDGRWLAVYGSPIVLIDLASGKIARTWALHEYFGHMAFAPDSRHLAISMTTGVTMILRLEGPKE